MSDTTITDHFGLQAAQLRSLGAVNSLLIEDAPYFIDPRLLEHAKTPELKGAGKDVYDHFGAIVALLQQAKKGDALWRAARAKLRFKESRGLRLGYAETGNTGRGIGPELGDDMLQTIQEFVRAGVKDASLLSLMIVVEKNIGPDRMSDMVASIIYDRLREYSARVFKELKVKVEEDEDCFLLPKNPFTGDPVVLTPAEILRNLPVGEFRGDWDQLFGGNDVLREAFNEKIQEAIKRRKMAPGEIPSKSLLQRWLLEDPKLARKALDNYKSFDVKAHDFLHDPKGPHLFDRAQEMADANPIKLHMPDEPSPDELHQAVLQICQWFKQQVEENGASGLIREPDGRAKSEKTVQLLFQAIAVAHAQHLNIDMSREPDGGRGPVDFKFSKGSNAKSLVELKLGHNERLVHGYEVQLPTYLDSERTKHGILVVVDYDGKGPRQKLEEAAGRLKDTRRPPEVIYVDAKKRPSASKA